MKGLLFDVMLKYIFGLFSGKVYLVVFVFALVVFAFIAGIKVGINSISPICDSGEVCTCGAAK